MAKTRQEKEKIIKDLENELAKNEAIVLVNFKGLDSKSLFDLRNRLKKSNCFLKVIKKTLLEKVLEKLNKKNLGEKIKEIKTEIALVFGLEDEIVKAKICYQFSRENKNLEILGGIVGNQFLEKEKIIELAELPSKQELFSKLVGSLQNPISNFVYILKGNIKGLIYSLKAIKESK